MTVSEIMQAKMGRPLFPTNYNFMKFYLNQTYKNYSIRRKLIDKK